MNPTLKQIIDQNNRQASSGRKETGPGAEQRRPDGSYGPPEGYHVQDLVNRPGGGQIHHQPGKNPHEGLRAEDGGIPLTPISLQPPEYVRPGQPGGGRGRPQPAGPPDHIKVDPQVFVQKHAPPAPFAGPPALKGVPQFWSSPQGPSRYQWIAYQQLINQNYSPQEAARLIRRGGQLPLTAPISPVAQQYPAFNKDQSGNWVENRPLKPGQLPSHIAGG